MLDKVRYYFLLLWFFNFCIYIGQPPQQMEDLPLDDQAPVSIEEPPVSNEQTRQSKLLFPFIMVF